jgi:TonB family protein
MAKLDSTQRRKGSTLGRWVALAAFLHLQLLLFCGLALHAWAPRQADVEAAAKLAAARSTPESISVSTVDDDTARKLIADMERLEEKAKKEQAKKEEEAPDAPGQVVDLAKPREERRPDHARFAAEYDSAVERETRKYGRFDPNESQRSRGDSDRNRLAVPEQTRPGTSNPASSPGALAMREAQPRRPSIYNQAPRGVGSSEEQAPEDPEGALAPVGGGRPRRASQRALEGGEPLPPGADQSWLVPTEAEIARAVGSGTQDHLRDVDEGDETALNAKRWVHATFFNRVKEQVRNHWKVAEEYQKRDPTGSIYGTQDRLTQVHVQLRPDGSLAKVMVTQPCGVDFLDDTAVEAFKEAQPFPNPPRQLVGRQNPGLIDFDFGFYFAISGAPHVRFMRYRM